MASESEFAPVERVADVLLMLALILVFAGVTVLLFEKNFQIGIALGSGGILAGVVAAVIHVSRARRRSS